MELSRREFLRVSAAAVAVLSSPNAAAQPLRRRKEISTLSSTELTSYRNGVSAMMALARDQPFSWGYQRAVHMIRAAGTTTSPSGEPGNPLADPPGIAGFWRQCKHGHPHFFPWHRWELLYWEEICRQLCGDTNFNLAYWDWIADSHLPAAARTPTTGNSLYHPNRNAQLNDGTAQISGLALNGFTSTDFLSFSSLFEGNPHGTVHVSIQGDMRWPSTAGLDPVFYMHHANIDRYWVLWLRQGGGRVNPTDAGWLSTSYSFQTVAGAKTPTAQQALTTEGLGYTYDRKLVTLPPEALKWLRERLRWLKFPPIRFVPPPRPPRPPGPGPDPAPWTALAATDGFDVDGFPTVIPVPKEASRVQDIQKAIAGRSNAISLAFEGLEAKAEAMKEGFVVEVFLVPSVKELQAGRISAAASVGSIDSFKLAAMAEHKDHGGDSATRLPVSAEARTLLGKAIAKDPAIVLARRATLKDNAGKDLAFDQKAALFSVKSVTLDARGPAR